MPGESFSDWQEEYGEFSRDRRPAKQPPLPGGLEMLVNSNGFILVNPLGADWFFRHEWVLGKLSSASRRKIPMQADAPPAILVGYDGEDCIVGPGQLDGTPRSDQKLNLYVARIHIDAEEFPGISERLRPWWEEIFNYVDFSDYVGQPDLPEGVRPLNLKLERNYWPELMDHQRLPTAQRFLIHERAETLPPGLRYSVAESNIYYDRWIRVFHRHTICQD